MVRKIAATLALASLVITQPALAVRSYESLPTASAKTTLPQGLRTGSKVAKAEDLVGTTGFIIGAITLVTVTTIILAATNGKHDGDNIPDSQSPG